MKGRFEYNILIVDDNPIQTKVYVEVLLRKLTAFYELEENKGNTIQLKNLYELDIEEIRGQIRTFRPTDNISLTVYNYNPTVTPAENQKIIINLIGDENVNIFWVDRGYYNTQLRDDKLYKIDGKDELNSNSDGLFKNSELISALQDSNVRQVAVHTYNPLISQRETDLMRRVVAEYFYEKESSDRYEKEVNEFKEKVYIIETSPFLQFFDVNQYITDGATNLLGTRGAYKQYGRILGNILFDLFFRLEENKSLSKSKYNFFKKANRNFSNFEKVLAQWEPHEKPFNKTREKPFKLGEVTFGTTFAGEQEYIIDYPYKEYYEQFDGILTDLTGSLFELDKNCVERESERWIYYHYSYQQESRRINLFENFDGFPSKDYNKIFGINFLKLLHSAIFYEPDFFESDEGLPDKNRLPDVSEKSSGPNDDTAVEIIYLFKNVAFESLTGTLHIAFWRRNDSANTASEEVIKGHVEEMWGKFVPLIEPEVEKNIIPVVLDHVKRQATKAAMLQYMCRGLSHNIGSHSIPQFNEALKKRQDKEECWPANELGKIIEYNECIQDRMEYLADFSSMSFSNIFVEHNIGEICEALEKRLLKSSDIILNGMIDHYRSDSLPIVFVDMPAPHQGLIADIRGDNLGLQALHVIVENFIRNIYKHTNPAVFEKKNQLRFEVSITQKGVLDGFYAIDIYDLHGESNAGRCSKIIVELNELIRQAILDDESHSLRLKGWGMLEMKTAAVYLSGMPIEQIDAPYPQSSNDQLLIEGKAFPFPLKASFYNTEGEIQDNHEGSLSDDQKNIGFRFYLPKPTFCLISKFEQLNEDAKIELLRHGIEFCDDRVAGGRHKFFVAKNEPPFCNQRFIRLTNELANKIVDLTESISQRGCELKLIAEFKESMWRTFIEQTSPDILGKELIYSNSRSKPTIIQNEALNNAIVFDSHGECISVNDSPNTHEIKNSKAFTAKDLDKFSYYESFNSASKLNNPEDRVTQYLLRESAVVRVSIFDERVQTEVEGRDKKHGAQSQLTTRHVLKSSGVFVPEVDELDLSYLVERKSKESKRELEKMIISRISPQVSYILVHFTLIEILLADSSISINEWYLELEPSLRENGCVLVFISGRGRPSNLPKGSYFVNYTTISNCVVESRSKLQLVTILRSLRKY